MASSLEGREKCVPRQEEHTKSFLGRGQHVARSPDQGFLLSSGQASETKVSEEGPVLAAGAWWLREGPWP